MKDLEKGAEPRCGGRLWQRLAQMHTFGLPGALLTTTQNLKVPFGLFTVKSQFAGSFKVPTGNEQRRCHPRCGGKTVTWFEVDPNRLASCLASLIAAVQADSRIVGARQPQSCAELPGKQAN